jgi:hypothetical protein
MNCDVLGCIPGDVLPRTEELEMEGSVIDALSLQAVIQSDHELHCSADIKPNRWFQTVAGSR